MLIILIQEDSVSGSYVYGVRGDVLSTKEKSVLNIISKKSYLCIKYQIKGFNRIKHSNKIEANPIFLSADVARNISPIFTLRNRVIYAIATPKRRNKMKQVYQALYAELEKYENAGVRMRLDNSPASPMQIVSAHMIKEETSYMRDYVLDDKGCVRELAFHQVLKSE